MKGSLYLAALLLGACALAVGAEPNQQTVLAPPPAPPEQKDGAPRFSQASADVAKKKLPAWLEKPPYWLPTPPEWGPPPAHIFSSWYRPQSIPQPVFRPTPFSQVASTYQAAASPYGASPYGMSQLPFPTASYGGGGVPPAVAPIGQPIFLDATSGEHALQGLSLARLRQAMALHHSLVGQTRAGEEQPGAAVERPGKA